MATEAWFEHILEFALWLTKDMIMNVKGWMIFSATMSDIIQGTLMRMHGQDVEMRIVDPENNPNLRSLHVLAR